MFNPKHLPLRPLMPLLPLLLSLALASVAAIAAPKAESQANGALAESPKEAPQGAFVLPLSTEILGDVSAQLDNESLIEQTLSRYRQASERYLAKVRSLAKVRILYGQLTGDDEEVEVDTPCADRTNEKGEAITVGERPPTECAEKRLAQLIERRDALENRKQVLEELVKRTSEVELELETYLRELQQLGGAVLEFRLRIADGVLEAAAVPEALTQRALLERQTALKGDFTLLGDQIGTYRRQFSTLKHRFERANEAVIEAQAVLDGYRDQFAQHQQRQEILTRYQDKGTEGLRKELAALNHELGWLQSNAEHLYDLVELRQGEVVDFSDELAILPAWRVEQPAQEDLLDSAATQQALDLAKNTLNYHNIRLGAARKLREGLDLVMEASAQFVSEGRILQDQFSQMLMLTEILEKREMGLDKLPSHSDLFEAYRRLDQHLSSAQTYAESARKRRNEIANEIANEQINASQAENLLATLREGYQMAVAAEEHNATLRDVASEGLSAQFSDTRQALNEARQRRKDMLARLEVLEKEQALIRDRLNTLKDPLAREAQVEARLERQRIAATLYTLANIPMPESDKQKGEAASVQEAGEKDAGGETEKGVGGTPDTPPLQLATRRISDYQDLISTRIANIDGMNEDRFALRQNRDQLLALLGDYIDILQRNSTLRTQSYAEAVELKKRMDREEGGEGGLRDVLSQALEQEEGEQLKQELAHRVEQKRTLEAEKADEDVHKEPQRESRTLLSATREHTGERLDLFADIEQLDQRINTEFSELDDIEQRRLRQQAEKRTEKQGEWWEPILNYVPSERARDITDMLNQYNLDLVQLERRLGLLAERRKKLDFLISSAQQERSSVEGLLPLLKEEAKQYEIDKEAAMIAIKARLQPLQANQLLDEFQQRTGRRVSLGPPLTEENKPAAIKQATQALFDLHVRIAAARKWIELLEERLSDRGIGAEIGLYRDQQGAIDASSEAAQRSIQRLSGHQGVDPASLPAGQRPETAEAIEQFRIGEIGLLRNERYQAALESTTRSGIEILLILSVALLAYWLNALIFMGKIARARHVHGDDASHIVFALNLFRNILRWTIIAAAIGLSLNSLGFDIGVILAGLGIGGLAVAIAAKETLSNIIGGITIFIERPFKIGDVIQINDAIELGETTTVKVQGLSWRTTQVVNNLGYHITMPNSRVAESVVINYSKDAPLVRDYTLVYVSPAYDNEQVRELIYEAMRQCKKIRQDKPTQVMINGVKVIDGSTLNVFEPRWHTEESYMARVQVLTELWPILRRLLKEAGIELRYIPFKE